MSEAYIIRARNIFEEYDADSSGTVDGQELEELVRLGLRLQQYAHHTAPLHGRCDE